MSSSVAKTAVTTPKKSTTEPVQESPGTWRHPRLAEIRKRQEIVTFSERNVRQIAINVCALAAVIALRVLVARTFHWNLPHKCVLSLPAPPKLPQQQPGMPSNAYLTSSLASGFWAVFVCICAVLLFNIGANLWPLARSPDDLSYHHLRDRRPPGPRTARRPGSRARRQSVRRAAGAASRPHRPPTTALVLSMGVEASTARGASRA